MKGEFDLTELPYTRQAERLHEMFWREEAASVIAAVKIARFQNFDPKSEREKLYRKWLEFLSDENALKQHIRCLKTIKPFFPEAEVRIYPLSRNLLNVWEKSNKISRLDLHEALIALNGSEISQICNAVLSGDRAMLRKLLNDAAEKEAFLSIHDRFSIQDPVKEGLENTKGRYYDLESVFERVNKQFWEGKLPRPRLTWAARSAKRKMGCYDLKKDVLSINPALDRPDVPLYVMEYLMYHELLHKALGVKIVNGRKMAHTAEFRRLEQLHPEHERAESFLNNFSRSLG